MKNYENSTYNIVHDVMSFPVARGLLAMDIFEKQLYNTVTKKLLKRNVNSDSRGQLSCDLMMVGS